MTPSPSQTPEPVVSMPLGMVALALVAVIGVLFLIGLVLTRRRRGAPRVISRPGETPWLANLLDGLPQAALVVDSDGNLAAWNGAAAQTLGWTSNTSELPLSLAALVGRVLQAGTTETIEIPAPQSPDRRLRATASPLTKEDGVLVLLQSPTMGSRSAESYRSLIGAVAHELRTPLTAILGHADILGSCDPQEEEALWRRSRDFIAKEAQRLARLVEDLLTLSRLDRTPLQRRPVNLRAVAEEAISALYQAAEERGVQLSLHSPTHLPRILGDRDRLGQVLINLLDNAVKFSPDGGQADIHLTHSDDVADDSVEVKVQDYGVGISSEDLPHIFDSLYRGERVRDTPGSGLGLTIVRTILNQHGTTIDVRSAPGQGTTFRFRLPCAHTSPSHFPTGDSDNARR